MEGVIMLSTDENRELSYLELRAAIDADPDLKRKVSDLRQRLGGYRTLKFWKGVQTKIRTLCDFRNLLVSEDDEILAYITDYPRSVWQRLVEHREDVNEHIRASGLADYARRLREKLERANRLPPSPGQASNP